MHKTSDRGIALITEFEGFEATAYFCAAGVPTIGYGHTKTVTRAEVGKRRISKAIALQLLRDDLEDAEGAVNKLDVDLTQGQFDALVSLVFNCGPAPLKGGVGKALKNGRLDLVPAQFMRWTRAGGKILKGLERRRRAECALWRGLDDASDDARGVRLATIEPVPSQPIEHSGIRRASIAAGGAVTTIIGTNVEDVTANAVHTKGLFDIISSFGTPTTLAFVVLVVALGWIAFRAYRDRDAI